MRDFRKMSFVTAVLAIAGCAKSEPVAIIGCPAAKVVWLQCIYRQGDHYDTCDAVVDEDDNCWHNDRAVQYGLTLRVNGENFTSGRAENIIRYKVKVMPNGEVRRQ